MAIKVNDISTVNQVPEAAKTVEGDGSFKFTLASAITDADLQAKVDELLSDITAQGNRCGAHGHPGYEKVPWTDKRLSE